MLLEKEQDQVSRGGVGQSGCGCVSRGQVCVRECCPLGRPPLCRLLQVNSVNALRKQTEEALLREKGAHQTVQEQLKQQQKNSKLCMSL